MKKVLSVVLSLFLMTGLIACSGGETQTEGSIVSTTTETVATSETAESTTGTIETTVEETTEASIETTTVEETTEVSSANTYSNLDDYVGSYTDGYNWISVYPAYGNTYYMDIYLTRLANVDRCSIELVDGKLSATRIFEDGSKISFDFLREDEEFSLLVTKSTETLLEKGMSFSEMKKVVPNQSEKSRKLLIDNISKVKKEFSKYGKYEYKYSYVDGILYIVMFSDKHLSISPYYVDDNDEVQYCQGFGVGEYAYQSFKSMKKALEKCGYEYPVYNLAELKNIMIGNEDIGE